MYVKKLVVIENNLKKKQKINKLSYKPYPVPSWAVKRSLFKNKFKYFLTKLRSLKQNTWYYSPKHKKKFKVEVEKFFSNLIIIEN